ncbi:MAG: phosphoribosylformylglycinamidine synthase I [Methanobacteriota archaeon]
MAEDVEIMKICILRAAGTNCDLETKYALEHFKCLAEVVHINQFIKGKKNLLSYDGLVIPGGFSFGDHIRSGAILGKIVCEKFGELKKFVEEEKPVLGICNGFQVLVESGLLPGFEGISRQPETALTKNTSSKYEDRWVYLRSTNKGSCIFTKGIKKMLKMPVAHSEGKFILPPKKEKEYLKKLRKNDQIVFCYARQNGELADGSYPENPNGSISDIAGICNPGGTIFGLMPHPERAFHRITYPDWTRNDLKGEGDGYLIFKNMVDYIRER